MAAVSTTGAAVAVWGLSPRPASVPRGRWLMRGALTACGVPERLVRDAEVLTSELVSNALAHARPPYELRLYTLTSSVVCEVVDGSPETVTTAQALLRSPAPRLVDPPRNAEDLDALITALDHGKRGLTLVRELSAGRCGIRLTSTSTPPVTPAKAAWFAIDR